MLRSGLAKSSEGCNEGLGAPFLAANLLRFNLEGLVVMPMSAAIVAAM